MKTAENQRGDDAVTVANAMTRQHRCEVGRIRNAGAEAAVRTPAIAMRDPPAENAIPELHDEFQQAPARLSRAGMVHAGHDGSIGESRLVALGMAVATVERLASGARHRESRDRCCLASTRLQVVLEVEESAPRERSEACACHTRRSRLP